MGKEQEGLLWRTEQRKVKELLACPYNPRKLSEEQKRQLIKSLQKFNLAEIPAINLNNQILAGHQRVAALLALGRGEEAIDVRVPNRELRKDEADEYMVRSNRNVGEWDFEGLGKNFNFEFLKETGFNDFELDKVFERVCKEDRDNVPFDAEEEYDKIVKPKTKRGDIYILGRHRVMCGSSTSEEEFERLMGGNKGRLIFTDPAYNVDYKSPAGLTYSSVKFGGTGGKIFNDNLSDKECLDFYSSVLKNLHKFTTADATGFMPGLIIPTKLSRRQFQLLSLQKNWPMWTASILSRVNTCSIWIAEYCPAMIIKTSKMKR